MNFNYKDKNNPVVDLTIYHIPGIKVGCTENITSRNNDNRRLYGKDIEIEILCSGPMSIEAASDLEFMFADEFKYTRGQRYSTVYRTTKDEDRNQRISKTMFIVSDNEDRKKKQSLDAILFQAKLNADPIRSEQKRLKCSKAQAEIKADSTRAGKRFNRQSSAQIQNQSEIKADPIRNKKRKERKSISTTKAQAEIKADPIRNEARSKSKVEAAAAIKADPVRNTARSKNLSEAQNAINNDPIRKRSRSKNMSEAAEKAITYKLDPITLEVLEIFASNEEAGIAVGYISGSSISTAKSKNLIKKGFLWK